MDTEDHVCCRVCGRKLRELNYHLSKMHGLSKSDYLSSYPDAPIISATAAKLKSKSIIKAREKNGPTEISQETRRKISEAGKRRHQQLRAEDEKSYLTIQRRSAAQARAAKGDNYHHSEETKAKMRASSPRKSKPCSDETKKKLSEARKGRKFKPHSPETLAKMRAAWERRKADKETYDEYRRKLSEQSSEPERVAAMRRRIARLIKEGNHNRKSSNTKPELKMKAFLEEQGISFEQQFIVNTERGAWTFDFYLPEKNMLVEIDSQYYHTKSFEVANRDRMKEELASGMGYIVARVSDKAWTPEIIFEDVSIVQTASLELRLRHLGLIEERLKITHP
jgi:very-short-patch-repair endonuclease